MEENKKGFHIVLYNEVAYFLALFILAISVNLTILSGWGAPLGSSLFYVLNQWIDALSMGQWSWVMQAIWLITLILIVQQVHVRYFFSFATSVLYGMSLDITKIIFSNISVHNFGERLLCFGVGFLMLGVGLQLFFKCSMPMVIYDLIVKEVTAVKHLKLGIVKTVLDVTILLLAAGIGLVFLGGLVGLGIGTVIIALFTGAYIQSIDGLVNRIFEFRPLIWGREPKQAISSQEQPDLTEVLLSDDVKNET